MIYASGDKYDGEWQGKRHGNGTFTFANGEQLVGEFNNGKWIDKEKIKREKEKRLAEKKQKKNTKGKRIREQNFCKCL